MYDLAIIGGGPGGIAAGVYASRKHLKTVFITEDWGGQSNISSDIQNWIGDISLSGAAFAKKLKDHLLAYADGFVTVVEGQRVSTITKTKNGFLLTTPKQTFESRAVLITTGASRKKLQIPGAAEFDQKGL